MASSLAPSPVPAPRSPGVGAWARVRAGIVRVMGAVRGYFVEQDPVFWVALTPALILTAIIFVRNPGSNYIFDEQEALLANPYVNDRTLGFFASFTEAFRKDFWGLPPTRSIGSYRPIPNLVWRGLWQISTLPWLHHWVNVIFHAVNAALLAAFAFAVTRRRGLSWAVGGTFLASAVLTEAVTGVVGIADVLGGFGVLLALHALRGPALVVPFTVALAGLFGLLCKESCLVAVPLLPWVAFVAAPPLRPQRPLRFLRPGLALVGAVAALVAYTEIRRRCFFAALPPEAPLPAPEGASIVGQAFHAFLRWFRQPHLPADPINNPLIEADFPHRVAGALRVYARGVGQILVPWPLSGDYSFPQEPVPDRLIFPGSVLGALLLVGVPLVGVGAAAWLLVLRDRELWRSCAAQFRSPVPDGPALSVTPPGLAPELARGAADPGLAAATPPVVEAGTAPWPSSAAAVADPARAGAPPLTQRLRLANALALLAIGLVWFPVAYFPHSNIPVALPTVRAERFWYLPAMGTAMVLAVAMTAVVERLRWRRLGWWLAGTFLAVQVVAARVHALDYTDDLAFWDATRRAAPRSAKAHLNYSVMVGARGRLEERLSANRRALELAPKWPMAHVYLGDTLCRLDRTDEAWPHYVHGFELAPNDSNLIALGLQCLWDHGAVERRRDEILALATKAEHSGSWLAYLGTEVVYNGQEHGGVPAKYRPRGYDQGPKDDAE